MTGIEPALSAWELGCHAPLTKAWPGQLAYEVVRGYSPDTAAYPVIGHAAGTLAGLLTRNVIRSRTATMITTVIINPYPLIRANRRIALTAKRLAFPCEAIFEIVQLCGIYVFGVVHMITIHWQTVAQPHCWEGSAQVGGVHADRRQGPLDTRMSYLIVANRSGKYVFMAVEGIIYLLHFERPYHGPMRHYVGFTDDLDRRLERHREGKGGKTTRRAFDQGISFTLARTWSGSLSLERQIKSRGPSNYCPLCPRWSSGIAPSNLTGANGFAGEDHSQGSAVRSTDAT
jgi:predicted GIY-YIG superfamily endonuclease